MPTILVELNGTDENPYHKFGLSQNPFPQTGKYELDADCLRLQSLGGTPIPSTDHIRQVLEGFSEEFIELCCQRFEKGKFVTFNITWEDTQ